MIAPIEWAGCYDQQWAGFITKDSFAHPAKFSRGLVERILDHMLDRGWISPGQTVGDPFGGVATGGIIAAYRGLDWRGVELEPRFVGLGQSNIAMHRGKLEHLGRPLPKLIQGDSRHFDKLLGGTGAVVTSPPYAESLRGYPDGIDWEKAKAKPTSGVHQSPGASCHSIAGESKGQIGALREGSVSAVVTSPPWEDEPAGGCPGSRLNHPPSKGKGHSASLGARARQAARDNGRVYGTSKGQIGQLSGGSVDACVTSPPYAAIAAGAGGLNTKPPKDPSQQSGRNPAAASQSGNWSKELLRYGTAAGQISRLKGGVVNSVVTSPPYGQTLEHGGGPDSKHDLLQGGKSLLAIKTGYGKTEGQITPETYWQAMRDVYAACFRAIKPGGYMAVVVKDYVKAKQRVRLCDDTLRLLEHCGFIPVERVHAMLTSHTQHKDLFTESGYHTQTRSRKSFFRRLAEKKGSPPIDFEEVFFVQKPWAT